MLALTPSYQIVPSYSTYRMWYVCHVEKMSIKISTQTHTHTQLMFCSTPNMIMGVRTRILSTRATRGKMKTVGVLERKSYRRPLQSRNCNWDNNLPHSTDHTYPTIRRLPHNAPNRKDVDYGTLQKSNIQCVPNPGTDNIHDE